MFAKADTIGHPPPVASITMSRMTTPSRGSVWSRSSRPRRLVVVAVAVVGLTLSVTFLSVGNLGLAGTSLGLTSLVLGGLALATPEK